MPVRGLAAFALVTAHVFAQGIAELGPAPVPPEQGSESIQSAAQAGPPAQWFDISNRQAAQYLYASLYAPFQNVPYGWTGNVPSCSAGTLAQDYLDAAAERFNLFRGLAGVPAGIWFDNAVNHPPDQQAALMFSANQQLSHSPPSTWTCYTAAGASAAGHANICISYNFPTDPGCVTRYVDDSGQNNDAVGHRRWVLYPNTRVSGTGDIPQNGSYWQANALTAWDSNLGGTRPSTRDAFVAWPPPGYVPYQLIPSSTRWSFSYPGANFSGATVGMTVGSASYGGVLQPVQNGYGDNTLVWTFNGLTLPPASDTTVTVNVNNVLVSGQPRNFQYQVIVFNPMTPTISLTPTAVYRDTQGAVFLAAATSAPAYPAGGIVASAPAAAQTTSGDTVVVARDASNGLWLNMFSAASNSWGTWLFAGGVTQGDPAVAVSTNGTIYFASRDAYNSYWLRSYTPGSGFGSWIPLGGVFATDPAMAAGLDGSIYMAGRDGSNAIWSGQFLPDGGFQGWAFGGAAAQGKPALSVGMDGAAYIAVRDLFKGIWMGRVQGSSWTGWYWGGGVASTDPKNVRVGNHSYTAILDPAGSLWSRPFLEGSTSGWQGTWTPHGGVLTTLSPAASGQDLYVFGADTSNGVWWYRPSTSTWTHVNGSNASGGLAAGIR